MKAFELRGGAVESIEITPTRGAFDPPLRLRAEVDVVRADGEILLRLGEQIVEIAGVDVPRHAALVAVIESGAPLVIWIAQVNERRAVLQIHRFFGEVRLAEPVTIGIDDRALEDLRRRHGVVGTVAEVARWLEPRIFVDGGREGLPRAVITAGPRGAGVAFRILGKGVALDVKRVSGDRLQIERVIKNADASDAPRQLMFGQITFADLSATGALATTARCALEEAVRSSNSYLAVWVRYNELEKETILRRARDFGALPYESCQRRHDGGFRFQLGAVDNFEARLEGLAESDRLELEAGAIAPTWETFEAPTKRDPSGARVAAPMLRFSVQERTLDLRPLDDDDREASPPASGFLFLSVAGDRPRLARREEAEKKLRTGWMPQLGLLLEDRPAPQARPRRREPLSDVVLRTFGGRPTERQREALDVALNTPDIALIQGPPGTGKTKVITALQRRLAELAEEGAEVSHRVLVTSAQHEAVENVVQLSEVFGLPAVKIGVRRGRASSGIDSVEAFRRKRIEGLRASLPDRPESERLTRARQIGVALLHAPTLPAETAARLSDLRLLLAEDLPPTLGDRLAQRIRDLSSPAASGVDPEEHELWVRAARGIRTTAGEFEDDGPAKAQKALLRLDAALLPPERDFLRRSAAWVDSGAPPWLEQGGAHKAALLGRLLAPPPPVTPELDLATHTLLVEIIDAVGRRRQAATPAAEDALVVYLDDLENDPGAVREALERYTVVLAATCQQAAGGPMRAALGITAGSADFETVIVDEAARANPLDLFIPMSMAKRRVILVGDHRQLPHMLEPDVERELAAAVAKGDIRKEAEAAVKESLFQRLWDILRRLEERDGNPRTVRLDVQFRMHPVLGDLVSRVFYEPHAGDGRITSGRGPEDFAHRLDGYLKNGAPAVAAWIDVPGGRGRAERGGRSKSRPLEATRIAKEVRRLMELSPELTFGVIAFYASQKEELWLAFGREGLAERNESGGWSIASQWRRTTGERGDFVERLALGTVDAFQGREFDVVFLSITRSNELAGDTEEQRRRKYGHLLLDNRLCVAMSRQHRLLVAVGDRAFIHAAEPLVALRELLRLCEGPHGVVCS